jgi:deoxyribose-phosphate aldolase
VTRHVVFQGRFFYLCRRKLTEHFYPLENIHQYLELTNLKPNATLTDIRSMVEAAAAKELVGVCVPPLYVRESKRIVGEHSKTKIVTVVGFPMGYSALAAKTEEIKRAMDEGADEIDGVLNIAALKSGIWNHVANDIEGMALATNMRGKSLKLILEVGMLTEEETQRVAELALKSRVKFLKTGTGMHGFDATPEQVKLLKKLADPSLKIKASGGVRTKAQAIALIQAGADRVGSSNALDLL